MPSRFCSLVLAAALAGGCTAPQAADESTAAVSDDASFTDRVRLLRDDFLRLEVTAYRTRMFELIREVRKATLEATEHKLDLLLAEAAVGADGLESLIVTHADALARRGTSAVRSRITTKLRQARDRNKWSYKQAYAGLLVPLGRYETAVVINVRADAMREVFDGLMRHPDKLSLEDLMGLTDVRSDLCGMEPLASIDTALGAPELFKDQQRDADCLQGKTKSGPGGTVHSIANGGCLDVNLDAFKDHDEYTIEEMNADLEQCTEDMGADGAGNPFADEDAGGLLGLLGVKISADLGPAAAEAVKGYFGIINGIGSFTGTVANKALDTYLKERAEDRANARADEKAAIDAEVEAVRAIVAWDKAQQATQTAENNLDAAKRDFAAAEVTYNAVLEQNRIGQASDAQVEAAKTRRDEAREDVKDAQKDVDKKKEAEAKAEADAKAAVAAAEKAAEKAKASGGDTADQPAELSAACSRLIANGHNINDPVDMKRLPANWIELMGRVDPRTVNPNPEADPKASDAMGLPLCGEDPATMHHAALPCDTVTDCPDADTQCGCSASAIQSEAAMQAILRDQATNACMAANCAPGTIPTAVGITCVCETPPEGDTGPRPPLPVTRAVVESVFMSGSAQVPVNGMMDPLSLFTREAMRR